MKSGQHGYIGTLQALCKRCDIDHASGCWLWLGATNGAGAASVYTWDYERGEKRAMTGSRAAWGLMHKRALLPGFVAYRVCIRRRCVWPMHMREGTRAQMGAHMRARGDMVGKHTAVQSGNIFKAMAARGTMPTPSDIVAAIRASDPSVTGTELARLYGIGRSTVSKIRRGESHRTIATRGSRP